MSCPLEIIIQNSGGGLSKEAQGQNVHLLFLFTPWATCRDVRCTLCIYRDGNLVLNSLWISSHASASTVKTDGFVLGVRSVERNQLACLHLTPGWSTTSVISLEECRKACLWNFEAFLCLEHFVLFFMCPVLNVHWRQLRAARLCEDLGSWLGRKCPVMSPE